MADETTTQNREDIIRISGELKLINQKLDNHISHMSQKISCLYRNIKLGGVMGKLKDMWSNMSKKGKMFLGALIVILLIIIYNYVF